VVVPVEGVGTARRVATDGAQTKEIEMSDNTYGIFRGPGPREQAQHERDMDRIRDKVAARDAANNDSGKSDKN
jgi:hypothetical protein